jgi:hypothetical protein
MKQRIAISLLMIVCTGCHTSDPAPATQPVGTTNTTPGKLTGMFVNAPGESIVGSVTITTANGVTSLAFDSTFMANGPDLKVYLSIDNKASDYKSLGSLKSASGTQIYTIPSSIDLATFGKYVVIWCQKYSVLFGYAQLT